jgi:hypothetical protein
MMSLRFVLSFDSQSCFQTAPLIEGFGAGLLASPISMGRAKKKKKKNNYGT